MVSRSDDYLRGFRHANKMAVKLLHEISEEMNDPGAKRYFDSAAFAVGTKLSRHWKAMSSGKIAMDETNTPDESEG